MKASLNKIYKISEDDVVAREVSGEFVIIPITSGVGDLEEEIYTLNKTGKAIWDRLDGKKSLRNVSEELSSIFTAKEGEIEKDVLGISEELLKRKIIVEVK